MFLDNVFYSHSVSLHPGLSVGKWQPCKSSRAKRESGSTSCFFLLWKAKFAPAVWGRFTLGYFTFSNKKYDVQAMSILGVLVAMLVHLLIIYIRIKI